MQVTELPAETRLSRLERLIRLYETGQVSDFMNRVLDKVFAQEAAEAVSAIKRIDSDLQSYESQYGMSSENFYQQFRAGELGDRMDFIEWGSLVMMKDDLQQRLQLLTSEA